MRRARPDYIASPSLKKKKSTSNKLIIRKTCSLEEIYGPVSECQTLLISP